MSTWSSGPYDNDDACSFMEELEGDPTWQEVRAELKSIAGGSGYLDAPDGCQAVAGAALVASAMKTADFLPAEYRNLLTRMGPLPPDLIPLARVALERVMGDGSELNELWQEGTSDPDASGFEDWLETLDQIQDTLDGMDDLPRGTPV